MADQAQKDQPSTFTPIHPFKMDDPRSWGHAIGMMDWDNDKIVFSKRSLLEFLKSMQVTVNTNFSEVQKLPKYASFGKLSKQATEAAVADLVEAEINDPTTDSTAHPSKSTVPRGTGSAGLKPSRKVVDPPGGKQSLKIYGEEYEEEDALSLAPARDGRGVDVAIEHLERVKLHVEPVVDGGAQIEDEPSEESRSSNPPPNFRPTRKVREGPGGKSTMGQALFGGYENETEEDREESRASAGKKKQQPQSGGGNLW